jgi:hypothetical protein
VVCARKTDGPYHTCSACRADLRSFYKVRRTRIRQQILTRYGNACHCCGERQPLFLTIDHIHNDGKVDRKSAGGCTNRIYQIILKYKGLNPRFQLLCWNCNMAKAHYGRCPHKAGRRVV